VLETLGGISVQMIEKRFRQYMFSHHYLASFEGQCSMNLLQLQVSVFLFCGHLSMDNPFTHNISRD